MDALDEFTDVSPMAFCFTTPEQINEYYGQLKLVGKLDKNSGTSDVYIVDKKRNLRVERKEGYKEGYDTFHPAD
jgi:predicted component of viral defense system (DUF524 family)